MQHVLASREKSARANRLCGTDLRGPNMLIQMGYFEIEGILPRRWRSVVSMQFYINLN
jgi:hypothetical protein